MGEFVPLSHFNNEVIFVEKLERGWAPKVCSFQVSFTGLSANIRLGESDR
jgi:hypothetical protein